MKEEKEFEMFVDDDDEEIYFGPLAVSLIGFIVLICIIVYFGFFVV